MSQFRFITNEGFEVMYGDDGVEGYFLRVAKERPAADRSKEFDDFIDEIVVIDKRTFEPTGMLSCKRGEFNGIRLAGYLRDFGVPEHLRHHIEQLKANPDPEFGVRGYLTEKPDQKPNPVKRSDGFFQMFRLEK